MLQQTSITLLFLLLIFGCKKEPKRINSPTYDTTSTALQSQKKSYNFFSNTEELKKLYQSDAWQIMCRDAKKIGLRNTTVAKLDSLYFINFTLVNTKASIFNQKMEALPAFRNFKEMSKSLTGIPLDYKKELNTIYTFQNHPTQAKELYSLIGYYNSPTMEFPLKAFQNDSLEILENYLTTTAVSNFEFYQQDSRMYILINGATASAIETVFKNLRWSDIVNETHITAIQQDYPKLTLNALVFENWQEMTLL